MTYIGEEFQKRFKTLPEDIQNALTAVATVDILTTIGKKNGLMVDQIGKMADEIWKVMLGLADPKGFIRNLAGTLNIDSVKASAIANEVNAQMFQPVRESLRKIYDTQQPPAITPSTTMLPASLSPSAPSSGAYQGEVMEDSPLKVRGDDRGAMNQKAPPMIYPQDTRLQVGQGFEEEFKKPEEKMFDTKGRTKELDPPSPAVVPQPSKPPPITPPILQENFTYPEKTAEVSRETIKGRYQGKSANYAGRDPYREAIEL